MQQLIEHTISGNSFLLSAERCIYWQEQKTLILSDLHLGKSGHFRKSGIAVPQGIFKEDMQRLVTVFHTYKPEQVIVIGDMFHSHDNKEHDFFIKWRKDFEQLPIQLVMGNHDILKKTWYASAGIQLCPSGPGSAAVYTLGNFIFTHDVNDIPDGPAGSNRYCFSGHIHPGISIHGLGKQSLRFPCFYFGSNHAVLPAFSRFTGTHCIKPRSGESVYAVLPPDRVHQTKAGIMKV